MNKKLQEIIDKYVETANETRKLCLQHLTTTLKLNNGNIDWEDIKLPEYVSVPYDGGNHPEYASNVFSTVYGVFFDEENDICLKTEDCDCYDISNVNTDSLIDLVSFLDTYTKEIGIK